MKRYAYILLFLILVLGLPAPAVFAETAYFSVIPFYAPEKIWNLYNPFAEHLTRTTGTKWELKLYHTHDAVIDALCRAEISVALLGPVPYGRAATKCGAKPLLVALGSDGKPSYHSVFITTSPDISRLGDVKGKKVGFFEGSTAAHVLPLRMLSDAGITIDMIEPVFLKGQDRIINALMKREIDAAGVKENLFERFRQQGLKVLKTSDEVPNFVFCASPQIKKDIEKKFVDSLLRMQGDRKAAESWDDEIKHGFILPPDSFLQDVLGLEYLFKKHSK